MTKEITEENWLEPDPVMRCFSRLSPTGTTEQVSGEEWLAEILKPQVSESVPPDVREIVEAARGSLVYGYLYYPLYFLGAAELLRAADTALTFKCQQSSDPILQKKSSQKFGKRIEVLASANLLDAKHWNPIRDARNSASHPKFQRKLTPNMALGILVNVIDLLNDLFPMQNT